MAPPRRQRARHRWASLNLLVDTGCGENAPDCGRFIPRRKPVVGYDERAEGFFRPAGAVWVL